MVHFTNEAIHTFLGTALLYIQNRRKVYRNIEQYVCEYDRPLGTTHRQSTIRIRSKLENTLARELFLPSHTGRSFSWRALKEGAIWATAARKQFFFFFTHSSTHSFRCVRIPSQRTQRYSSTFEATNGHIKKKKIQPTKSFVRMCVHYEARSHTRKRSCCVL